MNLTDTHAVVTGASSGIGAAIARELSARGARVTLLARRRELLEGVAAELPGAAHVVACDLAAGDPAAWIPESETALGPIDLLVNNAGVQVIGPTAEVDADAGERSLQLNLAVPLRLVRALLPGMLARGRGAIVNVASMAALTPTPGMTYYNAGKSGLAGASEALRAELRTTPVGVVTVYPGIIETDMGRAGLDAYDDSKLVAMQPRGTEPELARVVAEAVERGRGRVVYPRVYELARLMPNLSRWLTGRFAPALADPR